MNQRDEASEALDRMARKGGRAHFSLRHGSVIHPAGEKPLRISEPMTDDEWDEHLMLIGARAEVYYADSQGNLHRKPLPIEAIYGGAGR